MEEQIRHGSILDQMRLPYPSGEPLLLAPQQDPGRVRNAAFFDKMYGDCRKGQVTPRLMPVVWLPNTWGHVVHITSVNEVDRKMSAISHELDELSADDKKYLLPRCLAWVVTTVRAWQPMFFGSAERRFSVPA